jgi:diaminopropionate ammonia-lyase
MSVLRNTHRGRGLSNRAGLAEGRVLSDPSEPLRLLELCPAAAATALRDMPELAASLGVGAVLVKEESTRMGLGSFKALGAVYAIARLAAERVGGADKLTQAPQRTAALSDRVFACASAGNHGMSVAVGARLFGARAIIYLADTVPEAFVARLHRFGAEVRRAGATYEASMDAAQADCERNGWTLLSDSSWPGYVELPMRVMQGYLVMAAEVADQIGEPPSHIFLQAGVGGLAAAMTAYFRTCWGDGPTIIVVEPDAAATLLRSIEAGRPVDAVGTSSIMGRLDCKSPSHLALDELARNADFFVTITDQQCIETVEDLRHLGLATTPSGGAGLAALQHLGSHYTEFGLDASSRVLAFMTEGPEDGA